jgi:hypothetical protein
MVFGTWKGCCSLRTCGKEVASCTKFCYKYNRTTWKGDLIDMSVREQFMDCVREHKMEVVMDNGVHRNLRFSKGSVFDSFGITTWPGHLCVYGDRGTYVFSRLYDMFDFFRKNEASPNISPYYWGEKIQAISRFDGYEEFDPEAFRESVMHYLEYWFDDQESDEREELREELERFLGYCDMSNEYYAYSDAHDWEYTSSSNKVYRLTDFHEYRIMKHTYNYLWCLYAIVWGIEQYDQLK